MKHKGFTVLEFLIVVAIMAILVSLILVGLNAARTNARDQEKISKLQKVALGIEQYHDICREYPANLIPAQTCNELNGGSLETLIPDIADYNFNSGAEFNYTAIALDPLDQNSCSSFHLWVQLEKGRDTNASRFDSVNLVTGAAVCAVSTSPAQKDATTDLTVYDIHK